MLNFIKSMNILGEMKPSEIYNYYKTLESKDNVEIINNINRFSKLKKFFDYYTNHDSKTLFDFIKQLKQKICDVLDTENTISQFNSNIDQYISTLTKFILVIKLTIEIEKSLDIILIKSKNYLKKLIIENDIKNNNIDSLLNDFNLNKLNHITFSKNKYSIKKGFSLSSLNIYSTRDYDQPINSNSDNKSQIKLLSDNTIKNKFQRSKESKFSFRTSSKDIDSEIKKGSILPLSKLCYVINKNYDNKKNNISETRKLIKKRTNISDNVICKTNIIKTCMELLEMINNLYNRKIVDENGKIKLKKLVIIKSHKLAKFYKRVYVNYYHNDLKLRNAINKLIL